MQSVDLQLVRVNTDECKPDAPGHKSNRRPPLVGGSAQDRQRFYCQLIRRIPGEFSSLEALYRDQSELELQLENFVLQGL